MGKRHRGREPNKAHHHAEYAYQPKAHVGLGTIYILATEQGMSSGLWAAQGMAVLPTAHRATKMRWRNRFIVTISRLYDWFGLRLVGTFAE